jgi:MYXO-CTERM domain-containing protein
MSRLAASLSFVFVLGGSSVALADVPNPKEDMPAEPSETSGGTTDTTGGEGGDSNGDSNGDSGKTETKKGNCTVGSDDAMLGLAALVLLGAGLGLRRRK